MSVFFLLYFSKRLYSGIACVQLYFTLASSIFFCIFHLHINVTVFGLNVPAITNDAIMTDEVKPIITVDRIEKYVNAIARFYIVDVFPHFLFSRHFLFSFG